MVFLPLIQLQSNDLQHYMLHLKPGDNSFFLQILQNGPPKKSILLLFKKPTLFFYIYTNTVISNCLHLFVFPYIIFISFFGDLFYKSQITSKAFYYSQLSYIHLSDWSKQNVTRSQREPRIRVAMHTRSDWLLTMPSICQPTFSTEPMFPTVDVV